MKCLPIGKFVEELKYGALGRGQGQRPVPLPPGLRAEVIAFGSPCAARSLNGSRERCEPRFDIIFLKEPAAVVITEANANAQIIQPCGRTTWTIKVNLTH